MAEFFRLIFKYGSLPSMCKSLVELRSVTSDSGVLQKKELKHGVMAFHAYACASVIMLRNLTGHLHRNVAYR